MTKRENSETEQLIISIYRGKYCELNKEIDEKTLEKIKELLKARKP